MKGIPRARLAVTLVATVIIKCLVLYGLWAAFFSHPQARHMHLPDGQLERHLFAAGPGASDLFLSRCQPAASNMQVQPCLYSTTS